MATPNSNAIAPMVLLVIFLMACPLLLVRYGRAGRLGFHTLSAQDVAGSHILPTAWMLAWRVFSACFHVAVCLWSWFFLRPDSPDYFVTSLRFFTMWTFYLGTIYFVAATVCTYTLLLSERQARMEADQQVEVADQASSDAASDGAAGDSDSTAGAAGIKRDCCDKVCCADTTLGFPLPDPAADHPHRLLSCWVWTMMHVLLPQTILVCVTVWVVLGPALRASGKGSFVYNPHSYCVHGINVFFALSDLIVNKMEIKMAFFPFALLFILLYSVYHFFYWLATSQNSYFFTDLNADLSIVWYLGFLIVNVVFYSIGICVAQCKKACVKGARAEVADGEV